MSRLRDESGMTLVELLVSMVLGLLILSATLLVIDTTWRNDRRAQIVNDQQQSVRISLDRMARQLRNLASPTVLTAAGGTLPRSVERNLPYDLIFQDVENTKPSGSLNSANVRRVRYCLEAGDPANATLWMQTQNWTDATAPTMPADTPARAGLGRRQGPGSSPERHERLAVDTAPGVHLFRRRGSDHRDRLGLAGRHQPHRGAPLRPRARQEPAGRERADDERLPSKPEPRAAGEVHR